MIGMLKRFGLMAAVSTLFFVLLGTGVFATNNPTLDISNGSITLSAAGADLQYTQDTGVATPYTGDITIKGDPNISTENTIIVESGTHNIILENVYIKLELTNLILCAFEIKTGATANVTLVGNNTLISKTSRAGLQVTDGAILNITEKSTGSLTAFGANGGAGIGGGSGNDMGDCGTITISGGTVTANGGNGAAGIGGGTGRAIQSNEISGAGGDITITGGTVKATGGDNSSGGTGGAGIGGGGSGDTAINTTGGAGGTITITGGYVEATAIATGAAGIGGGAGIATGGAGSDVIISGGVVKATGYVPGSGTGIGPGTNTAGTASVANGTFSTTYTVGGTPIIGTALIIATGDSGVSSHIPALPATGLSGIILNGNVGEVYDGNHTLSTELTIPSGGSLTIDTGNSLTIKDGGSLILEDRSSFVNNNSLNVLAGGSFRLIGSANITGAGTIDYANPVIDIFDNSIIFKEDAGEKQFYFKSAPSSPITYTGDVTIKGTTFENNVTVTSGEHNITLDDVDIDNYRVLGSNAIHVGGSDPTDHTATANITLKNGNKLKSRDATALNVAMGSTVHITAASTGTLEAIGRIDSAGIGGAGIGGAGGNVIIAGGTVNAEGGDNAAGIGGGNGGDGGNITILGGIVNAEGGDNAAGIGGGRGGAGGTITISRGTVQANGGNNGGAGIGGGFEGYGGTITISGADVMAKGTSGGVGIGAGNGGTAGTVNIISGTTTAIGGEPMGNTPATMLSAFTAKPTLSPLPGTAPIVEVSSNNDPFSVVSVGTDYHTYNMVRISFGEAPPAPTPAPTTPTTTDQTNSAAIAPLTGVYFE